MATAAAIVGSAVIGSEASRQASRRASRSQRRATDQALTAQERMFQQQREDLAPWRQAGIGALNTLMGNLGVGGGGTSYIGGQALGPGMVGHGAIVGGPGTGKLMGEAVPMGPAAKQGTGGGGAPIQSAGQPGGGVQRFSMSDFEADPGYQFRLEQGQRAIERSAAARGGLNSGRTMRALAGYGQGLASQEYGNAYNRFMQEQQMDFNRQDAYMNRLAALAGVGQTTAGQMAGAAGQYGSGMASAITNMGNADAAAAIAQGNQTASLLGSGMMALGQYYGGQSKKAAPGGVLMSDERMKTDIEKVGKDDLDELRRAIKPYIYKYKDEQNGEGEWLGVMAQDVYKTKLGKRIVHRDENGTLMLNLKKALSLMFMTLGEV